MQRLRLVTKIRQINPVLYPYEKIVLEMEKAMMPKRFVNTWKHWRRMLSELRMTFGKRLIRIAMILLKTPNLYRQT